MFQIYPDNFQAGGGCPPAPGPPSLTTMIDKKGATMGGAKGAEAPPLAKSKLRKKIKNIG